MNLLDVIPDACCCNYIVCYRHIFVCIYVHIVLHLVYSLCISKYPISVIYVANFLGRAIYYILASPSTLKILDPPLLLISVRGYHPYVLLVDA